jgi:hypothetical protein
MPIKCLSGYVLHNLTFSHRIRSISSVGLERGANNAKVLGSTPILTINFDFSCPSGLYTFCQHDRPYESIPRHGIFLHCVLVYLVGYGVIYSLSKKLRQPQASCGISTSGMNLLQLQSLQLLVADIARWTSVSEQRGSSISVAA